MTMAKLLLSIHVFVYICSLTVITVWLFGKKHSTFKLEFGDQYGNSGVFVSGVVNHYGLFLSGITLLNVWTIIGFIVLIVLLQKTGADCFNKPIIFLVQQASFLQLLSFVTLNWILSDININD
eukprot:TCONS_00060749-protein